MTQDAICERRLERARRLMFRFNATARVTQLALLGSRGAALDAFRSARLLAEALAEFIDEKDAEQKEGRQP
jgi:hypothetical protein